MSTHAPRCLVLEREEQLASELAPSTKQPIASHMSTHARRRVRIEAKRQRAINERYSTMARRAVGFKVDWLRSIGVDGACLGEHRAAVVFDAVALSRAAQAACDFVGRGGLDLIAKRFAPAKMAERKHAALIF